MMFLYGITLVPLAEYLKDAYHTILSPFYANDATFDWSARRSVAQLRLMMDRRMDQDYFPEPSKYFFIADNPEEKEAVKREFEWAGLNINYIFGGRYLEAYLGPRE